MKKNLGLVFCMYLLSEPFAMAHMISAVVPLSGGGTVAANTSLNLSLNGLTPGANYSVICYIDTVYPFQYMMFGTSFTDTTSKIMSYTLNGNNVTQDTLIIGHNIAVINGNFTSPSTASIVFTNLDMTNPFNVNHCFAIPIQSSAIQRIDVANMLWNTLSALTETPVQVAFMNNDTSPCFTTTLAYNQAITVLAGVGQSCVAPITSVTITPVDQNSAPSLTYSAPSPTVITSGNYLTQITINQNIAPVYDPANGELLTTGAAQAPSVTL